MSVVGFDIGNENCVIAVVKQRGVDVLLNDESNRETPALVCFGEKQRFLGSAGAASAMMHPKSTISQVKRLVGRRFADPDVQKDLKVLPFETSEGPDGSVLIHLKYLKETCTFKPVQIVAMLFAHLKSITETNLGTSVSDCVIGVPSYFTDLQRRAYLNAATIAGLKPLRLIHDCTATGLGYGVYKTDFPSEAPIYVAFIDIGHCDTQVSIAAFQAGKMKLLSHAFDRSLGGRDFDEVLFSHFAEKFNGQYSIDVYSNVRACNRLRAACEKLKKVLSANLEAPLNIECLMDEKDVNGFIKREEFENLASGLLERICIPCNKALADAGLTVEKIYSVELVGSGSRIPAITRLLSSLFKREPRRTLNASECVARGCALQCAMLSPVFRVRDYEVVDSIPFSIGLSSDEGLTRAGSNDALFLKGEPIPSVKVLTFECRKMLNLEAFYANPDEVPHGTSPKISCFTIGPFLGSHGSKMSVKVKVQLNLHGIISIESATLFEDHLDDSVTAVDFHSNFEAMDVEPVSETVENVAEVSMNRKSDSPQRSADGTRNKKANGRLHVPVYENIYGGMTKDEILEAQEKELQLIEHDRTMELTKDMKNSLESYVYEMRSKLFNTYRSFASEEERDGISRSRTMGASASPSLWLAPNPSKRWGELFFLLYTPFWLTLCLGIVVPFNLYENFTELEYLLLGLVSAVPSFAIPMLLVGKADRGMSWSDRYWVKASLWIIIFSYVGNYFWTHYFFTVLGASYTFPSWKMNNVPHTTFLLTHVCFLFYHVASNMTLRRLRHCIADLPEKIRWATEAAWILALAYFIAYLETIAISNFPYYQFVDRESMYKVGSLFYAIYFIVSFPMFLRIDEKPGNKWDLARVAVDALGAAMLVTIILDLWRIFLGPIVPIPDAKQCPQVGLPWFSRHANLT